MSDFSFFMNQFPLSPWVGSSCFPRSLCFLKVWWQDATLSFVYFSYFYDIHTFIQSHSYNTFIHRHSLRPVSISSSLVCSVGKTSLWCRTENRTRACLTARRRATNWATPHHYWATPHQITLLHVILVLPWNHKNALLSLHKTIYIQSLETIPLKVEWMDFWKKYTKIYSSI